ncbi:ACT domain-containing protein [Schumannella soli]|uniref:ACT domain-containing protein n=1 Tax=Schumannella soli TaxID=2590779 RepID=A0A506XN23_9MICO|nr:ACT domain-containing protein [Schumannella soli]TPW74044.1 ACT domain-containing protein [Schumannella soli]
MTSPTVQLDALENEFTITRLDAAAAIPPQLLTAEGIVSITRTERELSIVTSTAIAPDAPAHRRDAGWVGWYVSGEIPFGLTGVVASLVQPLAAASCPVFVVSTFDSDLLLVPSASRDLAEATLRDAGHRL